MGLFTEFINEYWRPIQQRARARGRETLSTAEMTAAMAPESARASAEVAGAASALGHEKSLEALAARGGRLTEARELRRQGLALSKERAETQAKLGRERLGLSERAYRKGRQLWPYALGLRGVGLITSGIGAYKQRQRDKDFGKALLRILGRGTTAEPEAEPEPIPRYPRDTYLKRRPLRESDIGYIGGI
jgi:hypothetical protein